jgi:putative effector of murein hydrolase
MTLGITTRNWLYVGAAFVVCLLAVSVNLPRDYPAYLSITEALGFLFATAVPSFAVHRWQRTPGVSYHWTLILALTAAFGTHYAASHR